MPLDRLAAALGSAQRTPPAYRCAPVGTFSLQRQAHLHQHAYSTDPIIERGGCLYGYFPEGPLDVEIDGPVNNSIRLRFEEALDE